MQQIPLSAVPNQTTGFNADGAYWQLHIYQAITHMCADVVRNGVAIMTGVRCFVGMPLMPYKYMHAPQFGNFIFDADPDWTNFGTSCNLFYLSAVEYAEYKDLIYLD